MIDNKTVIRYNILLLVDCVWDAFGEWTDCSADCGTGTQTRTRAEATLAEHGGAACVGDATETQYCNTHKCTGTKMTFSYETIYPDTNRIFVGLKEYFDFTEKLQFQV